MNTPNLIVVTGLRGSSTTTLAGQIASKYSMPLIEKDMINELLFDSLQWSYRAWSKKIGLGTYALMDYYIEQNLSNGGSLIVESNFKPEFDNEKFQQWQDKYNYTIVQIVCSAESSILYERFSERAKSGNRHPGHGDVVNDDEWKSFFANAANLPEVIDVQSKVIRVDTSDFSKLNIREILDTISITVD